VILGTAYDPSVEAWRKAEAVECRTKPVKDQPEMVRIVPTRKLEPGSYFLAGKGPWGSHQLALLVNTEPLRQEFIRKAREAFEKKAWGKATAHGTRALELEPGDKEIRGLLGQARKADEEERYSRFAGPAREAAGKIIAVGGRLGVIALIDAGSNKQTMTMKGHRDSVRLLAFHPEGKILASASCDRTLGVWDTSAGRETHREYAPSPSAPTGRRK
jgi:hypothetical protein